MKYDERRLQLGQRAQLGERQHIPLVITNNRCPRARETTPTGSPNSDTLLEVHAHKLKFTSCVNIYLTHMTTLWGNARSEDGVPSLFASANATNAPRVSGGAPVVCGCIAGVIGGGGVFSPSIYVSLQQYPTLNTVRRSKYCSFSVSTCAHVWMLPPLRISPGAGRDRHRKTRRGGRARYLCLCGLVLLYRLYEILGAEND